MASLISRMCLSSVRNNNNSCRIVGSCGMKFPWRFKKSLPWKRCIHNISHGELVGNFCESVRWCQVHNYRHIFFLPLWRICRRYNPNRSGGKLSIRDASWSMPFRQCLREFISECLHFRFNAFLFLDENFNFFLAFHCQYLFGFASSLSRVFFSKGWQNCLLKSVIKLIWII